MSVVSINVCGYFIYLYGCWVISSFFLSIHVSMAGVLYTMVSYILLVNKKRKEMMALLYVCVATSNGILCVCVHTQQLLPLLNLFRVQCVLFIIT